MHRNIIYIATSLDGYIADANNQLDWLFSIPNPDQNDMGFSDFMQRIDAVVMGRTTFETVCGFDGEWPYDKPVFVLSNSIREIPVKLIGKAVHLVRGEIKDVISSIHCAGFKTLYIDGGSVAKQCLAEDLIDEMIITIVPILLGDGIPLFGNMKKPLQFIHVKSERYFDYMVKNTWHRQRK
ncbi:MULTISPECIES: dihydrofolate reductase family protein [Providencia]|uniref:dihydrofolate reductase family protein n=1 Tax=Providencia TaxID=586 RepID=UPI00073CD867|nr:MULTISPECIES: dihydrofolate reductase family protein [Providencia]SST01145.1 riboflavin-specific deaminase C-terminal domain [Acinetobacter baumannii]EMD1715685.1 dihydrofolate reductase [Providencia stuartii]KSX94701.1 diacylglycerol kinase [Providencia stuartii]MBG5896582.1 dihydrofolate reductase [Providencia stuartii]MBG5908801.1 dihydrofolate reductase [Providencia stuartii]